MPISYAIGDALQSDAMVVAHGCNARGSFGAGFAKAVAQAHPRVAKAYFRDFEAGVMQLGGISWAVSDGRLFANLTVQPTYGRGGRHIDYDALASSLSALDAAAREGIGSGQFAGGFDRVAMPAIGSDQAGGDWSVIEGIIRERVVHATAIVHALPGKLPTWWHRYAGSGDAPRLFP